MFEELLAKINHHLETLVERISIRQLLIVLLLILVGVEICVFAISTYETIYNTIYNERLVKLKDIDNLVVELLDYQNSP